MVANGIAESLAQIWRTLRPFNVPMAIVGGIALAVWDRPRFTRDVDLLIRPGNLETDVLLDALRAAHFRLVHAPPVVTIGDLELVQTMYEPPDTFMEFRVDLLLANSDFHISALERRVPTQIPGIHLDVDVLASEDLVVLKLCGGRVIDRADAAALLRANRHRMDVGYLTAWCRKLQLESALAEIWDEAFPGERPPFSDGR